ncbi:MAG TPA: hypothetical protein VJ623_04330 [Holophagaceae bacterium]|nr:hypothetical protein [Holophagaceae bacterium]
MSITTPLAFRPSFAQRTTALLLFVGSWMVGLRIGSELIGHLPRLWAHIHQAQAVGEPTFALWFFFSSSILGGLLGIGGLLVSLALVVLLEGTHVLVDELGITVQVHLLPPTLARWAGAGRLSWKHVGVLRRSGPFFVVEGLTGAHPEPGHLLEPTLRFLLVDELEALVTLIVERSPNVKID